MKIEPEIIQMPAFTVVGLHISTSPMAGEIPALWGTFGPRIDEVSAIAEPNVSYGIMENLDLEAGSLDYMAAVSVTNAESLPLGMVAKVIEPNSYAVFPATLNTLGEVFGYIVNTWTSEAPFEQIRAPYFERYNESFNPDDPSSIVHIHIPVIPRQP